MRVEISGVTLELVKGDITSQPDIEAIVNSANRWLKPGGGVSGAIHRAAGEELAKECEKLAPIEVGEAVITKAYKLPNSYVIHVLGPVYGKDKPEDELLSKCYENALRLADERGVRSVAFPSISTGIFGYPVEEASRVALRTVFRVAPGLRNVRKIRFVLFSEDDLRAYERALSEILEKC
ncbi:MAG: macro domain-containing protein [Archaeoglobi archaeon]|nr:macro domain-containing protein [Candidatus Mnemosynella bozhongmuii]